MPGNGNCAIGSVACCNDSARGSNACRFPFRRRSNPAAAWDWRRAISIAAEMSGMRLDFDAMPTLGDIPRYHTRTRPEHPAITFEGRTITWAELDGGTNRVANALLAAGCVPGDRIAYLGKG